ncbi:membrane protein [Knoellia sinensis KCTC 19936]|uniref:Membrane protein n=1 Tax=Knoellia sinensis KCTC 19936 TaxID=1385520 RepID=A0A0A0JFJ1_9MICO|nr:hypothetical protein [Knoellia sinensis]KGN34842.1 membrane protein [Knoellia sinensis KCTC 19936]
MHTITRSLVRAQLAAQDLVDGNGRRSERGDVPGWVLITLMTAALVAVIWGVAEDQFRDLFARAIDRVSDI